MVGTNVLIILQGNETLVLRRRGIILFYTGIKVKLKNERCIHGSLLNDYKRLGYLFVSRILDNGNVFLSNSPHGGLNITASDDMLIPIYDENILDILDRKKEESRNLDKEIRDIRNFINERCRD